MLSARSVVKRRFRLTGGDRQTKSQSRVPCGRDRSPAARVSVFRRPPRGEPSRYRAAVTRPSRRIPLAARIPRLFRQTAWRARDRGWSGVPPRCRCPSTTYRVSFPVSFSSFVRTTALSPPRRSAVAASPSAISDTLPPIGTAPSATTTMLKRAPHVSRSRKPLGDQRSDRTEFRESESTSAPPATPA